MNACSAGDSLERGISPTRGSLLIDEMRRIRQEIGLAHLMHRRLENVFEKVSMIFSIGQWVSSLLKYVKKRKPPTEVKPRARSRWPMHSRSRESPSSYLAFSEPREYLQLGAGERWSPALNPEYSRTNPTFVLIFCEPKWVILTYVNILG